jgi:predicted metal-dependent hydrolase
MQVESPRRAAPPAAVVEGVGLLHEGCYWKSHEAFERAWVAAPAADRALWQALAQLAAAFVHAERGRWRPATRLLGRVVHNLEPYPAVHGGVDVDALRSGAGRWQARLIEAVDGAPWRDEWRPEIRLLSPGA